MSRHFKSHRIALQCIFRDGNPIDQIQTTLILRRAVQSLTHTIRRILRIKIGMACLYFGRSKIFVSLPESCVYKILSWYTMSIFTNHWITKFNFSMSFFYWCTLGKNVLLWLVILCQKSKVCLWFLQNSLHFFNNFNGTWKIIDKIIVCKRPSFQKIQLNPFEPAYFYSSKPSSVARAKARVTLSLCRSISQCYQVPISAPFIDTRTNINSVPAVTCLALHSKCRVSVLPKCIHTPPALKEPVFCLSKRGTYVSFFSSLKRENEGERERRKEAGRISQLISASMKAESVQRGPLCTHTPCAESTKSNEWWQWLYLYPRTVSGQDGFTLGATMKL